MPGRPASPYCEVRQRFAMLRREAQESRIRRQIEGPLLQAVKPFVHDYLKSLHATVAQTASTMVAPDADRDVAAQPPARDCRGFAHVAESSPTPSG